MNNALHSNNVLHPKVVIKHYPHCKKVFVGFDVQGLSLEEIDVMCERNGLEFNIDIMMIIVLEITEFNTFNESVRRNHYEE